MLNLFQVIALLTSIRNNTRTIMTKTKPNSTKHFDITGGD